MNKRLEEAINAQINAEFWSAYLYLSMAQYFEAEGKPGFANWFKVQFKEEQAQNNVLVFCGLNRTTELVSTFP